MHDTTRTAGTHARVAGALLVACIGILGAACGGADGATDDATASSAAGSTGLLRTGVATVWDRAGVFVAEADAINAGSRAAALKANGFSWVMVRLHDGLTSTNESYFQSGWIQQWRDAGFSVGAWGVEHTEPEAEAQFAASLVKKWGFDFYVADAELEYKYTTADGSPSSDAYSRSKRFVQTFRAQLPNLPGALSSYGDRADIDYAAWRNAGFHWMPQAYWNDYDFYQPSVCVQEAVKNGWPLSKIHPTVGIWGGGIRKVVTGAEYADDLRAANTAGFSIFLGETVGDADLAALRSSPNGGSSTSSSGASSADAGAQPPPPPKPTPKPACTNACNAGEKKCVNGDDLFVECKDEDGDGCTEWSHTYSCGQSYPGTTCSAGYCVGPQAAPPPPPPPPPPANCGVCSPGTKQCLDGNRWQDCGDFNHDGCYEWGQVYSCGVSYPGTTCRAGYCVGN